MAGRLTRRERWFVGVGVVAAAAIGAGYAVMLGPAGQSMEVPRQPVVTTAPEFTSEDEPLTSYVARLRSAGEATTLREAAAHNAPTDVAAAPWVLIRSATLVLKVGMALESDSVRDPAFWPWNGADSPDTESPENLARLRALAPRLESACDRIAHALQAPRCRFPFEEQDTPENTARAIRGAERWMGVVRALAEGKDDPMSEAPPGEPLPVPEFRNFNVRMTALKALAGAAVGAAQPARRLDACRTLLVFGRKDEPTKLLDLMIEVQLVQTGVQVTRHGVEGGTQAAAAGRAALDEHLAGNTFDRLGAALVGERAHTIDMYRVALLRGVGDSARPAVAKGIVDACEAMRAVAALHPSPVAEWLREVDRIAARGGRQVAFLPSVGKKLVSCNAATRLARVALAAAEHRATRGDFPASLDELRPMFADGLPLDPFTDAPFVYEATATGVRIASVGRPTDEKPLDDETLREKCLVWELKR